VAEEADDALDRLFHPEKLGEGRVDLDRPIHEDAADPRIEARVDQLGLADRLQHTLGGTCHHRRILRATAQIFLERHLDFTLIVVKL
jgi:hypothetical protein